MQIGLDLSCLSKTNSFCMHILTCPVQTANTHIDMDLCCSKKSSCTFLHAHVQLSQSAWICKQDRVYMYVACICHKNFFMIWFQYYSVSSSEGQGHTASVLPSSFFTILSVLSTVSLYCAVRKIKTHTRLYRCEALSSLFQENNGFPIVDISNVALLSSTYIYKNSG